MKIVFKNDIKRIIDNYNLKIIIKDGFIKNQYVSKEFALLCNKDEYNKLLEILKELYKHNSIKYKTLFHLITNKISNEINGKNFWY